MDMSVVTLLVYIMPWIQISNNALLFLYKQKQKPKQRTEIISLSEICLIISD